MGYIGRCRRIVAKGVIFAPFGNVLDNMVLG